MNDNIEHILKNWPYDPDDDLTVRIIDFGDSQKLQMRIDMGVIQMELDGNPTGEKPENEESWFEYYMKRKKQIEKNQVNDFFSLNEDDCKKLRREAVQYYYRYLCLMKLGDYRRVIRDTYRNLRLFAFIKKYASSEMDRWALDQYRPYVIMMNTRARASLAIKNNPKSGMVKSLDYINRGIGKIVKFYEEYGIASEMENSLELSVLKALKEEFLLDLPLSLEEQLQKAVKEERFEDAAILRDKIQLRYKNN
ncbi:UvrB/UvrC motif-containing protein [Candidatus Latescibacterota bacterium]